MVCEGCETQRCEIVYLTLSTCIRDEASLQQIGSILKKYPDKNIRTDHVHSGAIPVLAVGVYSDLVR